MKTQESRLSKKSYAIVGLLSLGRKVSEIQKMGYPKSTIIYHKRKLFEREKYEKYLLRVAKYNKPKNGDPTSRKRSNNT